MNTTQEAPVVSGDDDGIIFACMQANTDKKHVFQRFQTECFCIAENDTNTANDSGAALHVSERGIFAYKILRQKHFYWRAKERLVRQLFRAVSRNLFAKNNKESTQSHASLMTICFSKGWCWFGNVGGLHAYQLRDTGVVPVFDHNDSNRRIGGEKFIKPDEYGRELHNGDTFVVCNAEFADIVSQQKAVQLLTAMASTKDSVVDTTQAVFQMATNTSDNHILCIFRKHESTYPTRQPRISFSW